MSHHIYMRGIPELINNLTKKLPDKIAAHMKTATKSSGELLKKRIQEKIGASHQHPAGTPPKGLELGERDSWYPPSGKKKEFGHEYLEGPPIPVKTGPEGYDFLVEAPTTHYWPFRRLGDLSESIIVVDMGRPEGTFASSVFMVSHVPDDLETREAGRYSFVIPAIFENFNKLKEQFIRGMKDVLNDRIV